MISKKIMIKITESAPQILFPRLMSRKEAGKSVDKPPASCLSFTLSGNNAKNLPKYVNMASILGNIDYESNIGCGR